jgi:outer membrane protein, multidrug efflux system
VDTRGLSARLEVLDAQRQLFSAEIDLSENQLTHLLGVIDLYRALGGGWSDDEIGKLMARPATALQ